MGQRAVELASFEGAVLTGNWLWLERRDEKLVHTGNRMLARLTAGIGAGLWVGMAAAFLISRVLSLDLPYRWLMPEAVFLCSAGACVPWAVRTRSMSHLWWKRSGSPGCCSCPFPCWLLVSPAPAYSA